jgi:hypothetical protein
MNFTSAQDIVSSRLCITEMLLSVALWCQRDWSHRLNQAGFKGDSAERRKQDEEASPLGLLIEQL